MYFRGFTLGRGASSKLLSVLILLFGFSCNLIAQNIVISGYVHDASTGERLIGANVIEMKTGKGFTTNNYGYFSLQIPATDTIIIRVSYVGFEMQTDTLQGNLSQVKSYFLMPGKMLAEVQIVGNNDAEMNFKEMSVIRIPIKQIEKLPAIGGETDIMKALQMMPGVQSGNEAGSGIYVRGGNAEQNLILLDDVPLYNVNHLGGFVSIFNTDAISNMKLIKGGFPANYGSRLSSILDIRMKEGNMKEFKGSGMIGMVASKISVEGPIKKDTTSYILSFRRLLYDLFMLPLSESLSDGLGVGYNFYDFNAKINHIFSDKNRVYLSMYFGDDKLIFRRKDNSYHSSSNIKVNQLWGNQLVAFRWNHIYNAKLFSNTVVSFTRYRMTNTMEKKIEDAFVQQTSNSSFFSGINDYSAKIDFEYFVMPQMKFKFGANSIYHSFIPGVSSYLHNDNSGMNIDTSFGNYSRTAFENSLYFSNEIFVKKKLFADMGIRATSYAVEGENYISVEPRIYISYLLGENSFVKASYAEMQQNVHLLSNTGLGIPADLWLPSTKRVKPSKSYQYALGVSSLLFKKKFEFGVEGYYKTMNNLIAYKEGAAGINATSDWQDKIELGGLGKSYGVEFMIHKKTGRANGWIAYTWSKSTRQFENLNNGNPFPYKYDRTHDVSVVFTFQIDENVDFSATWVYGTGNAFTMAASRYNIINDVDRWSDSQNLFNYDTEVYEYNGLNNYRMIAYHRLDVGFNFSKKKKWGERTWNVSIYNVYNRQNPYYYFLKTYYDSQMQPSVKLFQQSLFPFIPSLSYSFKF